MKYNNGYIYKGKWKNNQFEEGKIIFINGNIFEGNWENNYFIQRKITYNNGDIYQRIYINNKIEGFGIINIKMVIYMKVIGIII